MKQPDFERMTEDEVLAWFKSAKELTSLLGDALPATPASPAPDPASSPAPAVPGPSLAPATAVSSAQADSTAADVSMMLVSIRLPVMLVEQLDRLAGSRGIRRADVIREAISVFMANEPERALDVLRRAHERPDPA